MVAMMYPSAAPLFQLYYRTIEGASRVGRAEQVGGFIGTHVVVWTLTGTVPLVVNAVVPLATMGASTPPCCWVGRYSSWRAIRCPRSSTAVSGAVEPRSGS